MDALLSGDGVASHSGGPGCGTPRAARSAPGPPGPNPQPSITGLSPGNAVMGGPGFTLTDTGANSVASSVVDVNGNPRTTTFVSATQLPAAIPATDIIAVGTLSRRDCSGK